MSETKKQPAPIQLYSWATPNGHKVHIMLEECGLELGRDWDVHAINIGKGDQFTPEFLKFSPNNKIPAMIDFYGPNNQQITLFESGAILMYLAAKTGKFMPKTIMIDLRS
jgi:GST-like protein